MTSARRVPPQAIIETLARQAKVWRIVSVLPFPRYRAQAARLAAALANLSQADRDTIAARAGVRSPSETTWSMVVDVVRERYARAPHVVSEPVKGGI